MGRIVKESPATWTSRVDTGVLSLQLNRLLQQLGDVIAGIPEGQPSLSASLRHPHGRWLPGSRYLFSKWSSDLRGQFPI